MGGTTMSAGLLRVAALLAAIGTTLGAPPASAQQDSAVLFRNVRIFDGKAGALSPPSSVLVRNNTIEKISASDITATAQVIDGGEQIVVADIACERGHRRRAHQHHVPMRIDQSRHQHAAAAVDHLAGGRDVRGRNLLDLPISDEDVGRG